VSEDQRQDDLRMYDAWVASERAKSLWAALDKMRGEIIAAVNPSVDQEQQIIAIVAEAGLEIGRGDIARSGMMESPSPVHPVAPLMGMSPSCSGASCTSGVTTASGTTEMVPE
jgi:hypothetical protein